VSDRRVLAVILGIVCLLGPSVVSMKVIGRQAFARGPRAVATPAAATVPQYLPFAAGRMVRVNQGNAQHPSHYDVRNRYGWDFGLAYGEPALLGLPGVVTLVRAGCDPLASWGCNGGYGNNVAVRAADGTCVRYVHLQTIAVSLGQELPLGAQIGTVGSSGNSTGPHLHYQREDCRTGDALASSFVEAGVPQTGWVVMSRLHPGR
jgi:murein DD-endopeptidase MepM/ murein hydrolase activator NlpD